MLTTTLAAATILITNPAEPPEPPEPPEPTADLAVHYEITTADPIQPGGTYDFELHVTNHGPAPAELPTVVIEVPSMLVVPEPKAPCAFANQLLICTFATPLEPGETVGFSGQAQLDADYEGDGSDIVRNVTVASPTPDPDVANNSLVAVGPEVDA
jgi:hypothetical protein